MKLVELGLPERRWVMQPPYRRMETRNVCVCVCVCVCERERVKRDIKNWLVSLAHNKHSVNVC